LPQIGETAKVAIAAGADGITVINTIPGLLVDVETRRPRIGFGSGGVSGAGLLPVGVLATWRVHRALNGGGVGRATAGQTAPDKRIPIIGVGGIKSATDALQYIVAGASLVAVGTAAMQNPRLPERIVNDLVAWCKQHRIENVSDMIGTLEWPS
jgi:dihydroorotate dehydrogenase (NAD+) catalytic subunit